MAYDRSGIVTSEAKLYYLKNQCRSHLSVFHSQGSYFHVIRTFKQSCREVFVPKTSEMYCQLDYKIKPMMLVQFKFQINNKEQFSVRRRHTAKLLLI